MALQKIKLSNGKIREIQEHLAFDTALQKQQGFVPCDDNGNPIATPSPGEKKSGPSKEPAVAANVDEQLQEKQIVEAHGKGLSYVEIARAHGMHWKKVEAIIKKVNGK